MNRKHNHHIIDPVVIVVLGCESVTALGLARSLRVLHKKVIGIAVGDTNEYCARSNAMQVFSCTAYGAELLDIFEKILLPYSIVAVLPATDQAALFLAENAENIGPKFRFNFISQVPARQFLRKNAMLELASESGFRIPIHDVLTRTNYIDTMSRFPRPYIVKPMDSLIPGAGKADMLTIRTKAEADEGLRKISAMLETGYDLTIQEFISSEDGWQLSESFSYLDACTDSVKAVNTKKIRIFPADTGSSSCLRTIDDTGVDALIRNFRMRIGYSGILDLEYFSRDGEYVFIEANPRAGTPIGICEAAGLNLPAAEAAQLLRIEQQFRKPRASLGILYVREPSEMALLKLGAVSFVDWLYTITKAKARLIVDFRDFRPMLHFGKRILLRVFS